MLTLPRIIERKEQPYIAVRRRLRIPFETEVGPAVGQLFASAARHNIRTTGPMFMKYNVVAMPTLEIDFGVPTAESVNDIDDLVSGVLPAGRYAETTWFGHYSHLMEVNAVLIGWAKEFGHKWDSTTSGDGDTFAARIEIYPNSPDEEPDPSRWQTTVMIKLAD